LDMGFHLLIFFTMLSSVIRSICSNQLSLFFSKSNYVLLFQCVINFLIHFDLPVTISCSCGAIHFSHDLSFERHQSVYLLFLEYPCFGSLCYCWANKSVIKL
jgi:hypothetical protein